MEPSNNQFNWAEVENIIDRPGSRGKHVVLRLYCDWYTAINSNCPKWLFDEVGVQRIQGSGNTWLTDFNDPKFISYATRAIQAFASRYNNDPRIQALQIGVLGYWGEWHNFAFGGSYNITDASKQAILSAYKGSFTNVPLQGRYPWREPLKSTGGIGFHNDYFMPNNGHSDEFDNALNSSGLWMNGPIGGEVPPRSDSERASELTAMYATPKGESMIRTGRYSHMMSGYSQKAGDPYFEGYMKLHRLMGYNYQIESASFANSIPKTSALTVQLLGKNIGVAPAYHKWNVQFAMLDASGQPLLTAPASLDLKTIKPQDPFTMSATLNVASLIAGNYNLAVRIIQPEADVAKPARWKLDARNTYILFANDMTTIPGNWDANNALNGGWSVLGAVGVR